MQQTNYSCWNTTMQGRLGGSLMINYNSMQMERQYDNYRKFEMLASQLLHVEVDWMEL